MNDAVLDRFRRREAENIAQSVKFARWSLVMIEILIREQEERLLSSDQPVDPESEDPFWEEIA